jgi:hypothetical protein
MKEFIRFFPFALQPNSGLGRLHKTFHFTSVIRPRTLGRTSWTGDKLVTRPLPVHKHRKTHTHNTNTKHPFPEWDSNPRPGVRASEDSSCPRSLGHRDRLSFIYFVCFLIFMHIDIRNILEMR